MPQNNHVKGDNKCRYRGSRAAMGVTPKNIKPAAKKDSFTRMETGVIVIMIQRENNQPRVIAVRVGSRHS